jgi:hypothetical protein
MRNIGKAWCDAVEHTFLPVVIRDIRTGRTFARYSCYLPSIVELISKRGVLNVEHPFLRVC